MKALRTGNLNELWHVAAPLMLTWLSNVTMVFVDRLYLAKYSLEALGAAVTAGTLSWMFTHAMHVMGEMCEVFVAQYNGSGRRENLGPPVWQLIWVAIFSIPAFAVLATFGSQWIYSFFNNNELASSYFFWVTLFGPLWGFFGACTGYFAGQGRTRVITVVAVLGNVINIALDPLFIFGVPGIFPELGITGAALATGLSVLFQGTFLFVLFFKDHHLGSRVWQPCGELLKRCMKIAAPAAIFVGLELGSWSYFYGTMAKAGERHLLIASVCQSFLILFLFYGAGLQKGASAIAGNLIGAGNKGRVSTLIRSGLILIASFAAFAIVAFIFGRDFLIGLFMSQDQFQSAENLTPGLRFGLLVVAGYLISENIRMLYSGCLIGAGDTLYILVSGIFSIVALLLIPTYIVVNLYHLPVEAALLVLLSRSLIMCLANFLRFYSGAWKTKRVIS